MNGDLSQQLKGNRDYVKKLCIDLDEIEQG